MIDSLEIRIKCEGPLCELTTSPRVVVIYLSEKELRGKLEQTILFKIKELDWTVKENKHMCPICKGKSSRSRRRENE